MPDQSRLALKSRKLIKDAQTFECDVDRLRAILKHHHIQVYDYLGLARLKNQIEIYTMSGTIECSLDLSQTKKAEINARQASGDYTEH